jgi:hypothetical protein
MAEAARAKPTRKPIRSDEEAGREPLPATSAPTITITPIITSFSGLRSLT